MTTEHKNGNGKQWASILLSVVNICLLPLMAWAGSTIIRLDRSLAAVEPTLQRVQVATELAVDKGTYGHDQDKHDAVHHKQDVDMAGIHTRIQEIRLDITRLELQLQQRILQNNGKLNTNNP